MTTSFDMSSQIARRLGFGEVASTQPAGVERRQAAVRCSGCGAASESFVFMSNGGDCCLKCARSLAETFGYGPVGMRADDITSLD